MEYFTYLIGGMCFSTFTGLFTALIFGIFRETFDFIVVSNGDTKEALKNESPLIS